MSDDTYYFPPGRSMARRVHGERSVGLLYGQRALLIGALEPLTYTGTMLSTGSGDCPFTRLARTAKIQETVFLGTREEADKALGAVHRLHERDQGLAARGGRRPPRRRHLLGLRPGADAVDAGGDRRLRPGDVRGDGAAAERRRARGALAGLRPLRRAVRPAARARSPSSYREFRAWLDERLASPDLHATPHALEMAPLVAFEQPVPLPARANLAAQNLIIKGTLPPRVREIFGIRWSTRPRGRLPDGDRHPPPRPPRLPAPDAPRPQRRLLRRVTNAEHRRGGTPTPELGHTEAA